MTSAGDKGTLIGIFDIHKNEIANGNRIRVQHVKHPDTPQESVEDEFTAMVFYHEFRAAFLYTREEVAPEDEDHNTYHFNSTSSRYEILGEDDDR